MKIVQVDFGEVDYTFELWDVVSTLNSCIKQLAYNSRPEQYEDIYQIINMITQLKKDGLKQELIEYIDNQLRIYRAKSYIKSISSIKFNRIRSTF